MTKTLVINAHPKVDSTESFTLLVLKNFLKTYKELNPMETIEQIDLYDVHIPMIDRTILNARERLANGELISSEELQVLDRTVELLKQFKDAKKYVIAMPLHNFNVPSKLKDYIDNIFIPRETYKFTENGSVGLLTDGRSLLVIQGSGSIYTNNDWYTDVEYSHKYLKSMFHFLGIKDYKIIRAQGTAIRNREVILETAYKEANEAAKHLSVVEV